MLVNLLPIQQGSRGSGMSNYQQILTSIRKMPGHPYYQPAFHLWNPWAWYNRGFKTPDRTPFGVSLYEGVIVPSPYTSGIRGVTNAPVDNNKTFIGVAPTKGVYGGLT